MPRRELQALADVPPLGEGGTRAVNRYLANKISAQLHLSRSLPDAYARETIFQLQSSGLVKINDNLATLTNEGRSFIDEIPPQASNKLLEGRAAIRNAIKVLSGHAMADAHYSCVWNTLQDGLAELFYTHGLSIAKMVGALVGGHRQRPDARERMLFERLGDKVLPLFSERSQGADVRQAIIDMFSERSTGAFEWLSQMCIVYLMMCSLGFESLSGREITAALRAFRLTIDTDIVLSFLCRGEDNHDEVHRLVNGWKALGGRLLVAIPSLEELAYHAWIAENDFHAVSQQLSKMTDEDARHLVGNVFVRSFRKLAEGSSRRDLWNRYINEYRGHSEWDYGRVSNLLRDEYGIDMLAAAPQEYDDFAHRVAVFLEKRVREALGGRAEELDFRAKDKCRRDGQLLAAVSAARRSMRGMSLGICLPSAALLGKVFPGHTSALARRPDEGERLPTWSHG